MLVVMSEQQPPTLLQLAGVTDETPTLANSAVVVIDAQREYLDGHLQLPAIQPALDNIERILAKAREVGAPVIHVAHLGSAGGVFDPAVGGRIIDQVGPIDNEIVVTKGRPNSFAGTTLRDEIATLGDPHLVLCGFMTHMCVSSTARAASDLDLGTTVVVDASGTRSLPGPAESPAISADDVHRAALAALSDRFSFLRTSAQLLEQR